MPTARPRFGSLILLATLLALLLIGGFYVRDRLFRRQEVQRVEPATRPTTQPATQAAAKVDLPPRTYMDLVVRAYPTYPTTQPLDQPLGAAYMGRFVLPHRSYLDRGGRLWITHPDAPATAELFKEKAYEQVILTRERPRFVHWTQTETEIIPHLVVRNERGDGFDLLGPVSRQRIGDGLDYDWDRAFSWDESIVVPRSNRASVFSLVEGRVRESQSPILADNGVPHAPAEIAFAGGPLVWIPPSDTHPGSAGAVRCVEDAWFALTPDGGWPTGILHLIPLLDGSILQLVADSEGQLALHIIPLDPMDPEEEKKIATLILQLSDPEQEKRDKAYAELTRYGPGLWSVAERLMEGEPLETQARLRDLLRARITPLLGGMQLVEQRLRVVARYPDGGALFFSDRGVVIPQGEQPPLVVSPAWLSVRPGQSIRLLPQELTKDLDPVRSRLTPWFAEWVVTDDTRGPRRFLGGELVPLLPKKHRDFSVFMGIARGGRWIFNRPAASGHAAADTRPTTAAAAAVTSVHTPPVREDGVLIIDPLLPDPTPRLPVWKLVYEKGEVGWDKNDWPAAKMGGAWALGFKDWRPLEEGKEPFFSKPSDVPPTSQPSTRPARSSAGAGDAAAATTAPASQPAQDEPAILKDTDGNYYFDGKTAIRVLRADGTTVEWPLPPDAVGADPVHLVRSGDGTLFLFNRPARVLRIRPTPGGPEPFRLEATFTRNIPETAEPTRIWLDPFDRIVIAYEGNKLAILFPRGYVPPATSNLFTAEDEGLDQEPE